MVTTLVNPETGVRFDFTGRHLRTSPATEGDVRRGLAKFKGDKVYLSLPPGVQIQYDKGTLQLASEYDARQAFQASQDGAEAIPRGNASHETWIAYAISQGMDRGEATSLTRDQLRARFNDTGFDPDAPPVME
jgi:hypothetical protein